MIRKIMPSVIATDLISVQPMSTPGGLVFPMFTFAVLDHAELDTGETWYTVRVNGKIRQWLMDEYVNGPDYIIVDSDNRVNCVDIPERILLVLQLKWAT